MSEHVDQVRMRVKLTDPTPKALLDLLMAFQEEGVEILDLQVTPKTDKEDKVRDLASEQAKDELAADNMMIWHDARVARAKAAAQAKRDKTEE